MVACFISEIDKKRDSVLQHSLPQVVLLCHAQQKEKLVSIGNLSRIAIFSANTKVITAA